VPVREVRVLLEVVCEGEQLVDDSLRHSCLGKSRIGGGTTNPFAAVRGGGRVKAQLVHRGLHPGLHVGSRRSVSDAISPDGLGRCLGVLPLTHPNGRKQEEDDGEGGPDDSFPLGVLRKNGSTAAVGLKPVDLTNELADVVHRGRRGVPVVDLQQLLLHLRLQLRSNTRQQQQGAYRTNRLERQLHRTRCSCSTTGSDGTVCQHWRGCRFGDWN
jgi:hypothetical protein